MYWSGIGQRRLARRRLLAGSAVVGAVSGLTLAGCGKSAQQRSGASNGTAPGAPRQGGKVNVRMTNDPFDWDMSFAGKSIPNDYGQTLAYDSLLTFKHGPDVSF